VPASDRHRACRSCPAIAALLGRHRAALQFVECAVAITPFYAGGQLGQSRGSVEQRRENKWLKLTIEAVACLRCLVLPAGNCTATCRRAYAGRTTARSTQRHTTPRRASSVSPRTAGGALCYLLVNARESARPDRRRGEQSADVTMIPGRASIGQKSGWSRPPTPR
jgi:hypothetical protein